MIESSQQQDINIDKSLLAEYFADDPSGRDSFLKFFHENLNRSFAELQRAYTAGNYSQIAFLAHRMRGSASHIGAKRLMNIFRSIEKSAKDSNHLHLHEFLADALVARQALDSELS